MPKQDQQAPDAATFGSTLGQAVWLMTMSKAHRDLPIREIENYVAPAVLFRQFKLYSKGKQPVAFLIWAAVSDEVKARLDAGDKTMAPKDWKSGANIVVLDVISPFAPKDTIEQKFLADLEKAQSANHRRDQS